MFIRNGLLRSCYYLRDPQEPQHDTTTITTASTRITTNAARTGPLLLLLLRLRRFRPRSRVEKRKPLDFELTLNLKLESFEKNIPPKMP